MTPTERIAWISERLRRWEIRARTRASWWLLLASEGLVEKYSKPIDEDLEEGDAERARQLLNDWKWLSTWWNTAMTRFEGILSTYGEKTDQAQDPVDGSSASPAVDRLVDDPALRDACLAWIQKRFHDSCCPCVVCVCSRAVIEYHNDVAANLEKWGHMP